MTDAAHTPRPTAGKRRCIFLAIGGRAGLLSSTRPFSASGRPWPSLNRAEVSVGGLAAAAAAAEAPGAGILSLRGKRGLAVRSQGDVATEEWRIQVRGSARSRMFISPRDEKQRTVYDLGEVEDYLGYRRQFWAAVGQWLCAAPGRPAATVRAEGQKGGCTNLR